MWFDKITEDVKAGHLSLDISRHLHRNRERIIYTIDFLRQMGISGKKVCEIGAGGIALACKLELEVHWEMLSSPDISKSRLTNLGYRFLCRLFPRMSNIIFCWAKV